MPDTLYVRGTPEQRWDILDFINYVFSQAARPHDFRTLLPKAYGDNAPEEASSWHYLALQNGKIRGVVAQMPMTLSVLDETLKCGMIGSVSVHPYARGEGHMKRLMAMAVKDARERQYDLMILGGQRQRYNYFGFERAGYTVRYTVTQTNLRHCLGDTEKGTFTFSELAEDCPEAVDFCYGLAINQLIHGARPRERFLDFMHSWHSPCRVIRRDGRLFGYFTDGEWAVPDETLLPYALRSAMRADGLREISVTAAPFQTERMAVLANIAEGGHIASSDMIRVLNWKNVLRALLKLESRFKCLLDGTAVIKIGKKTLKIAVQSGQISVEETTETSACALSEMEALRLLFGLEQFVTPSPMFFNWLPLPFFISNVDEF